MNIYNTRIERRQARRAQLWASHFARSPGKKKGQELDPLSLIIGVAIGWAFYMARRYDDAIEQIERTVELDPSYLVTHWILGLLLGKIGRYELAIAEGVRRGSSCLAVAF